MTRNEAVKRIENRLEKDRKAIEDFDEYDYAKSVSRELLDCIFNTPEKTIAFTGTFGDGLLTNDSYGIIAYTIIRRQFIDYYYNTCFSGVTDERRITRFLDAYGYNKYFD